MRRKIPPSATLDELMALPEGLWHEAPDGFDLTVVYEDRQGDRRRLMVPISKALSRQLRGLDGTKLSATVEHGMLVLEQVPVRRTKKARRA